LEKIEMTKLYKSGFVVFGVTVAFLCLLVGCGGSETSTSSEIPSETYSELPDEIKVDEIQDIPIEPVEEDTSVTLTKITPFSEEIAWVKYIDTDGIEQIGWLHTDGHIDQPFPVDTVTQLSENYSSWSGLGSMFSGGYSCINTGDAFVRGASEKPDRFLILNSRGEITTQSPDDGSSYEVLCGSNGLYLVKQSIRNMAEKSDKYGILDSTGNWVVSCTACNLNDGNPLSPVGNITRERKELGFGYCGEHVFLAYHGYGPYEEQTVFYNAESGKTYQTGQKVDLIGSYYNALMPIKIDDQLFVMTSDFELTPIAVDTIDEVIYSDGIIFTENRNYSGNRGTYLTDAKFYRVDGSVLVDLSQYELLYDDAYELYRYFDGYAAIVICGVDGDKYLGIIDLDGNFTFEPKSISAPTNRDLISTFSSGVIVCAKENSSVSACIVDINGNEILSENIEWDQIDDYVFRDGFACDGKNLCYVGVDGELLETHTVK